MRADPVATGLPTPSDLELLPADGGSRYNRLVFEQSPYLLQHATNPVDWYPWGEEAFARARQEDKPLFLSIGYATCHWCHVMERESFEDPEVAELLNRVAIPIKVDREERPDVDRIYMAACQAMTGSGGWPLNLFLTPDRKPFFAGTYFPRLNVYGHIGLMSLLRRVDDLWHQQRTEVEESAQRLTGVVAELTRGRSGPELEAADLDRAYNELADRFDRHHKGFGRAPKFPTPHNLTFLLRYGQRTGEPQAGAMVFETLLAMRRGGIFDHVGLGFHRYATDARWLVPHFEKMLYDQAGLARIYTETYQATGDERLARTAREIFAYVRRDLTAEGGGFYSAEDADSEGEEGRYYLWRQDQVQQILGDDEAQLFGQIFGLAVRGNFVEEASGEQTGANIPHRQRSLTESARQLGLPLDVLVSRLETSREKLLKARATRPRPLLDDKILTDWNGLMISALAIGHQVLGDPELLDTAVKAQRFLADELTDEQGRLLKLHRNGKSSGRGQLDDYAFVVQGLLDLHDACGEASYLDEAQRLTRLQIDLFWDEREGGFFHTDDDDQSLIVRAKEIQDGAIPSGNSVAASNLARLASLTGAADLLDKAKQLLAAFAGQVRPHPSAHCALLGALEEALASGVCGDACTTGVCTTSGCTPSV